MRYWIIIDDRHAGPFSAQQLIDTGLTADTLVWYEGLPDWTRAANVAELAEGLAMRDMAEKEAGERVATETAVAWENEEEVVLHDAEPQPVQPVAETVPADTTSEAISTEAVEAAAPQVTAEHTAQPVPTTGCNSQAAAIKEPCPPAYIAWSIIATILCCTIVGIPAIVFASMTKSAYYKGDIAKAKRYSELAQWFVIAAITLGAISWPFQMAFMSMIR